LALTSAHEVRVGLRWLSRGLIAYGLVGLVVAVIGLGAVAWVNGRVTTLRHEVATTAQSFTVTVDQSRQGVSSAAGTVSEVRSDLIALEAQLRSVNILGATPLSASADAVGRIATSIEGLDTRLSLIGDSLNGDRQALAANATSLGQLGDVGETLAARLGSGVVEDSLGDLQRVISVTLLMYAAWSAVPAVGAVIFGIWLRRELGRSRSA
jgi:hypothetical protein